MSWLLCVMALAASNVQPASVEGHVLDAAGQPVVNALVIAESVSGGNLTTAQSGSDGGFALNGLNPGLTGVFAYAAGHAFGGFTVNLAPGQRVSGERIALAEPASVAGRVSGYKSKALEGARIVRVALLGDRKVSIPFDKLQAYGIAVPVSEDKGKFHVDNLPKGTPVALKFDHAAYPVQAVTGLTAGDANAKPELIPGVTLTGNALIRGEDRAVANVDLTITNAQPPYESVMARSDNSGRFQVKLKPGVYTFEAAAAAYRSAGLQRVTVTGETMDQRVNVHLMPTGTVVGEVRDAKSNSPVAGAKLILESSGNPAGVAITDTAGRYRFTGASGLNKVYLAETPGFQPGETRSMEVTVPGAGEFEMPVFWATSAASLSIKVIDAYGGPVVRPIVTVLSPPTLGWQFGDASGNVSLSVGIVPEDGRVAGIALLPSGAASGVFAIDAYEGGENVVQVYPVGDVRGTLRASGGEAGGVIVTGRLVDDAGRPSLVLWQCVSRPDGTYGASGVPPYVQQRCFAFVDGNETPLGTSFSLEPGATHEIEAGTVAGSSRQSAYGQVLAWQTYTKISGVTNPGDAYPAVVFFAPADETLMAVEAVEQAEPVLRSFGYRIAVVSDGAHAPLESRIPVMQGAAPGPATTYITDDQGKVVLETFGLPPLASLSR